MAIPSGSQRPSLEAVLDSPELVWGDVKTKADGPAGALPLTDEMLRHWPSGDLFSLSQNAGMGWEEAAELGCRACASPGGGCLPGHGSHLAGCGRGPGDDPAACGTRALWPANLARRGPPLGPGACRPGRARDHV